MEKASCQRGWYSAESSCITSTIVAKEKAITLAYDGAEICYFPSAAAAAVATAPEEGHYVSVKRDCDEDDPDADR